MEEISIRYGENVTLPLDTADSLAVSADIYIGRPGEIYVLTKNITLTEGVGTFEFSSAETSLPLGTYYYQINVTDVNGDVAKYPSPNEVCSGEGDDGFPKFVVYESLDEQEVS